MATQRLSSRSVGLAVTFLCWTPGCYVHRAGWLEPRVPTAVRLSRQSPIVWFSLQSGDDYRPFDPQHGRMRSALVIALQNAGAVVVEPGTTSHRHLELTVTLRRTGHPSAAAVLANATLSSLTIGLLPVRQPLTVELIVRARSTNGTETTQTYRERIVLWEWLPVLLLPRRDPLLADEHLIEEFASTVVADLQVHGLLPLPVAPRGSLQLSWER